MKTFLISFIAFGLALLPACKKSQNRVVARAGSVKITYQDLSKEIDNAPVDYQNYLATTEGKKQFLDILLREKILMNAAERSGIARRKEIQKNLQDYKERLKEQEGEFRKGLILREYLRELKDKELKVGEDEIKKYFEENKSDFQSPMKVTASHILSQTEADAQAALKRLKKGEDFAKVAEEVSTDPSASRGGMIGEISKGDLADLPEFEAVLFKMKTGEISKIVKTRIGYHIVKKNGEIRLPSQTYEQAAPQIHRVLEKRKFDGWIEKAKKEQKVWIDDKLLASIPVNKSEKTGAAEAQ